MTLVSWIARTSGDPSMSLPTTRRCAVRCVAGWPGRHRVATRAILTSPTTIDATDDASHRGPRAALGAARPPPSRRFPPMATTAPTADRSHQAAKRYIYAWGDGTAEGDASMRDLLGGKGAGLAEMTKAGLPTPPSFTITTEACNDYFAAGEQLPDGLWDDVLEAVKEVERRAGKGFGDASNPLLVSVRSGAKFSMPGMMDTVLNLGLNGDTLHGLIALTNNERFGWDAYRRFIQMFGRIVMEVSGERFDHALEASKEAHGAKQDTDLDAAALRDLVDEFKS